MKPWELEWVDFELPDGYKAQYSFDGTNVSMIIGDDDIPPGMNYEQRLAQCYEHFFTNIFPTL